MKHLDTLKSSADIMGFVEQLVSTKAAPKSAEQETPVEAAAGQPPAEPKPEEPAPKTEEVTPPATEGETPPAEQPAETPPAEEPAPETPAPEEEGEDPDTLEPIKGNKARLSFKQDDKVGRLAARFMQRNRDMTMPEAVKAAEKELGVNQPEAARPAPKPDGMPDTVEGINAEIEKLRNIRKEAATNLSVEQVVEIGEKIDALRDKRTAVVEAQREEQREAVRAYTRGFRESQERANALYAFAGDPESPGGKLMIEIDNEWEANGDRRFNAVDKPELLAKAVAARLNIPPKSKTPAATAKPAAPGPKPPAGQPAPKKDVIPGGASRTTPQTTATLKPLDQAIQTAGANRDAKALDKVLADLGITQ